MVATPSRMRGPSSGAAGPTRPQAAVPTPMALAAITRLPSIAAVLRLIVYTVMELIPYVELSRQTLYVCRFRRPTLGGGRRKPGTRIYLSASAISNAGKAVCIGLPIRSKNPMGVPQSFGFQHDAGGALRSCAASPRLRTPHRHQCGRRSPPRRTCGLGEDLNSALSCPLPR